MDKQILYSFIITTLAGLSTLIGAVIIFFKTNKKDKIVIASLSFAAAVMLTISFTDLIPESLKSLNNIYKTFPSYIIMLIFLNIGVIISLSLDKYLPTKDNNSLYRVGIISMIAILLHNIPEGMATFMASNTNISLGIALSVAIACHNIPEGISIAVPIFYSTGSKKKAIMYTLLSGLSELFGAIITFLFLKPFINDFIMGILFATIAGIMIYISIYELFPTSLKYNNKKYTYIFYFIGILFMLINHFIF